MSVTRTASLFLAACALVSCFSWSNDLRAAPHPKALDCAAQIRNLSIEEAARGLPVKLRAVVTYNDPLSGEFFVQDATGGIYVSLDKPFNVTRGQQVEITGITSPGDFAPEVVRAMFAFWAPASCPRLARFPSMKWRLAVRTASGLSPRELSTR